MKKFELKVLTVAVMLAFTFICGCSNDNVISSGGLSNDNMSISVLSEMDQGDNSGIIITEAKALIEKVEVETEPSSESIYLKIEPFVVNLFSLNSVLQTVSGRIPEGNYSKIKFKIHKPEDYQTPPDPEFKTGNSGNQRFSVIIKGTYNGSNFVYRSRKSVNMVFSLNRPLSIGPTMRNVTIKIDIASWFRNGSDVLDPSNSSNEDQIDDNIRDSFRSIFIDDDRNGSPDDN